MDPNLLAIALTALTNVLFLGFIYGKMVTRLDAVTDELRSYAGRTDRSVDRHDRTLEDHSQRIARLEVRQSLSSGIG